jgi:hypothetical protein
VLEKRHISALSDKTQMGELYSRRQNGLVMALLGKGSSFEEARLRYRFSALRGFRCKRSVPGCSSYAVNGTDLTDALTGRLARAIKNRLMDKVTHLNSGPLPFPLQHALLRPLAEAASTQKRSDLMPLWAGQSVRLCHSTQASEFITRLIVETDAFFSGC